MTQMRTDKFYSIDHSQKIFAADSDNAYSSTSPDFFGDMTDNFFEGKEYREFEDLGREGNLRKFRIRMENGTQNAVTVFIDETTGIMVRQEFTRPDTESGTQISYIYEIKDLRTEVDDSVFVLPTGYRKVTWDEYSSPIKKNR